MRHNEAPDKKTCNSSHKHKGYETNRGLTEALGHTMDVFPDLKFVFLFFCCEHSNIETY